jgi:hypothetical protein
LRKHWDQSVILTLQFFFVAPGGKTWCFSLNGSFRVTDCVEDPTRYERLVFLTLFQSASARIAAPSSRKTEGSIIRQSAPSSSAPGIVRAARP